MILKPEDGVLLAETEVGIVYNKSYISQTRSAKMPCYPGVLSSPCPVQLKKGEEQKSPVCKMELFFCLRLLKTGNAVQPVRTVVKEPVDPE